MNGIPYGKDLGTTYKDDYDWKTRVQMMIYTTEKIIQHLMINIKKIYQHH